MRREFDHQIADFRQGHAARGAARRQLPQEWRHSFTIPEGGFIENLDELPWVTKVYKRDLDFTPLQRSVSAESVHLVLHVARLSGACVRSACGRRRTPVTAGACARPTTSRTKCRYALENFPGLKEIFFDDDTFNYQKKRTIELCAEAEAAEVHLVLHVARHHRLRHAEGDEGSGLPAADRRLRIGRSRRS